MEEAVIVFQAGLSGMLDSGNKRAPLEPIVAIIRRFCKCAPLVSLYLAVAGELYPCFLCNHR